MSRSFGLVGLPNAGKSTVFNALTAGGARVEAYPFCTVDPHRGVAGVPDMRLDQLHTLYPEKRKVHTTIEVVDIAGLVAGAAQGEGLGNQFLAEIRGVDAILHVVRCFDDVNVAHPVGSLDVKRDVELVDTELLLKDLETLKRREERAAKVARTGNPAAKDELAALHRMIEHVAAGTPLRIASLPSTDADLLRDLAPLTAKPVLFVANLGDAQGNDHLEALRVHAESQGASWVSVRGRLEAEVAEVTQNGAERLAFLQEWGILESALERLLQAAYALLDLVTFYTVEGPEVRAWTVVKGTRAPDGGAEIHGDFRDRFVLAEVMDLTDLLAAGSERALRDAGRITRAGRDYAVRDGDVIHFIAA